MYRITEEIYVVYACLWRVD